MHYYFSLLTIHFALFAYTWPVTGGVPRVLYRGVAGGPVLERAQALQGVPGLPRGPAGGGPAEGEDEA